MANREIINKVDAKYRCVTCGAPHTALQIIQDGDNPRLRCSVCKFLFTGEDSVNAQKAGVLPEKGSSPEALASAENPKTVEASSEALKKGLERIPSEDRIGTFINIPTKIPRNPKYVFLTASGVYEFVAEKDLKKTALKWESHDKKYTLYELIQKKSEVTISID